MDLLGDDDEPDVDDDAPGVGEGEAGPTIAGDPAGGSPGRGSGDDVVAPERDSPER